MSKQASPKDILDYWQKIGPAKWWTKDSAVDKEIHQNFGETYDFACSSKLDDWSQQSDSALALVILLDQFSRNLNRESGLAFARDEKALKVAKHAVSSGFYRDVDQEIVSFFYLPYMHCERLQEQHECVLLMHSFGEPNSLEAAITHREIIQRFGRFPHRNKVLSRATTPAEQVFLDDGGFKG